ncbi:hypothetical protein [Erwinia mallotivora]|uniref:hypothetical protein n=1 Tax=Erwinia mallotivora TaxID=69222 RepID=UPI001362F008|nr:hypothetical protein [Erwinia mallotivora]
MKYTVAGKSFLTKELIKKEAQRILNKGTIGNAVKGEDYDFLLSLFKNHRVGRKESRWI